MHARKTTVWHESKLILSLSPAPLSSAWYQAAQILAVLGFLILLPVLVVMTPYTCIPNLRRRSQASWAFIVLLSSSGQLQQIFVIVSKLPLSGYLIFSLHYPSPLNPPPPQKKVC